jgi:predicted ATPase
VPTPFVPLLKSLKLENFLSYGPGSEAIGLSALNVLIGPNGSGKSNLVEALSLLRAVPKDLPLPIRKGGGVQDWLWHDGAKLAAKARLEVVFGEGQLAVPFAGRDPAVRYWLEFGAEGGRLKVFNERMENELAEAGKPKPYFYFGYEQGRPTINVAGTERHLERADIDPSQSILAQRRDPEAYPELTLMADLLRRILVYRTWQFGPDSTVRGSCRADVRTDALSEELDNLPARLSVLKKVPAVKKRLLELLRGLAPGFDDLEIVPEGGSLQLYLVEGNRSIAAQRLSDGTLRYLCLLAILLAPEQAPLIVLEEPELGLHPDILPSLRDLMLEASERTQLVVTTHSSQLLDALTEHAGSVLVCEKQAGGSSTVKRLVQEEVDGLRGEARAGLGSLWMSGHLGGTRW